MKEIFLALHAEGNPSVMRTVAGVCKLWVLMIWGTSPGRMVPACIFWIKGSSESRKLALIVATIVQRVVTEQPVKAAALARRLVMRKYRTLPVPGGSTAFLTQ